MTIHVTSTSRLRPLAALVMAIGAVAAAPSALAGEDTVPWFLSASETLTWDSNFSRTDDPQAEAVSSTALLLGLNKDYGRQNYRLSAQAAANRYVHYKDQLNNESGNVNGGFRTGLLSNWQFDLGGTYSRNLNPIKDNVSVDRVVKNIRTYRDANLALRYGVDAIWSIAATGDVNTIGYSRPSYRSAEAKQNSHGLQGTYYATDLLSFTLGARRVNTNYPQSSNDRTLYDRNIDLSTNWQVTGLSNFNATVTRRKSTYSDDKDKTANSWNGSLGWSYTPRGVLSYSLSASRYSGADRQNNSFFNSDLTSTVDVSNIQQKINTLNSSTNYRAGVSARLTGKVSASYAYGLSKNRYNYANLYTGVDELGLGIRINNRFFDQTDNVASVSHSSTLSVNYNHSRLVQTQCSAQLYSQSRDQYGIRYDGRSVDCTLTLTID